MLPDEVDEGAQRCGYQAAPGVVEEGSREALPPGLQHGLERTALKMRTQPVLEQADDAGAGNCRSHGEIRRPTDADEQRSRRLDADHFACTLELPKSADSTREPPEQAGMAQEVARMTRPATAIEIVRRGGSRKALHPRADGHGDHFLLEPLAIADSGIASGREDIDEALLGNDLQPDLRKRRQERRHDRGQHQPRRADRHIESERARRTIAISVHDIERRFHLGQSRPQPLVQTAARLGWNHAAGGSMQQSHAELRFQAAHRLAEAGRAASARSGAFAKAARTHHRDESTQIAEIHLHCSLSRTACADCARLSRAGKTRNVAPSQRRSSMSPIEFPDTFKLGDRHVSRMGYGAMQLAGPGVFGPPKDRAAALAVLREAIALGANHIDTSDFYGPHVTNQLIREALHPYPDDLVIVTKIGARRGADASWLPAFSAEELTRAVHDNLRNLRIDVLEVVNLRAMHGIHVPAEGSIEAPLTALAELQRQGLVRHIGLSNVTPAQIEEGRRICEIVCVQNHYNLAHRADDALIEQLAGEGIAYVPFFPLGGFTPLQSSILSDVAGSLGATPMQVALAWLLRRAANVLLIPGTSSLAHLRENLAAAALDLSTSAVAALDGIGAR